MSGTLTLPSIKYNIPTSFGSIELGQQQKEPVGQKLVCDDTSESVPMLTIDSLNLQRADLLKIDVEGMEMDVLHGAAKTIAAFKPMLCIEFIKSDSEALKGWLRKEGYQLFYLNRLNYIAVHEDNHTVQLTGFTPVE